MSCRSGRPFRAFLPDKKRTNRTPQNAERKKKESEREREDNKTTFQRASFNTRLEEKKREKLLLLMLLLYARPRG